MVDFSQFSDEDLKAISEGRPPSRAPNGYDLNRAFPPDFSQYTDEQLLAISEGRSPLDLKPVPEITEPEKRTGPATIGELGARAKDEFDITAYGALRGFGNLIGYEDLEQRGKAGVERNILEAEQSLPAERMAKWEDVKDVGSFARYIYEQGVVSSPAIAIDLASTIIGNAAIPVAGGIVLPALLSAPQYYGQFINRQVEESGEIKSQGAALATAALAAASEGLTPLIPMGPILKGPLKGTTEKVAKAIEDSGFLAKKAALNNAIERNAIARTGARTLEKGATEAGQEVFTQGLERLQAGLPVTDEEALQEYKQAALTAGPLGGIVGGTAGLIGGPQIDPRDPKVQDELRRLARSGQDEEVRSLLRTIYGDTPAADAAAEQLLLPPPGPDMSIPPSGARLPVSPEEAMRFATENADILPTARTILDSDASDELKQTALQRYIQSGKFEEERAAAMPAAEPDRAIITGGPEDLSTIASRVLGAESPIEGLGTDRTIRWAKQNVDAVPGLREIVESRISNTQKYKAIERLIEQLRDQHLRAQELGRTGTLAADQGGVGIGPAADINAITAERQRRLDEATRPSTSPQETMAEAERLRLEESEPLGAEATAQAAQAAREEQLAPFAQNAARLKALRAEIEALPHGEAPAIPMVQDALGGVTREQAVQALRSMAGKRTQSGMETGLLREVEPGSFVRYNPQGKRGPENRMRPGMQAEGLVTPEAQQLLDKVARGGAPSTVTKNLRRILEENGIEFDPTETPVEAIQRLREKSVGIERGVPEGVAGPEATALPPRKPGRPRLRGKFTTAEIPDEAGPENTRRFPPTQRSTLGGEKKKEKPTLYRIAYEKGGPNPVTGVPGVRQAKAGIVNYAGRHMVIADVNGVMVPFYLSTGMAGKAAPSGKWYPFFGLGKDGWINKTNSVDMVNYYGSPALRRAAEQLDRTIGDTRSNTAVPEVNYDDKEFRGTLNKVLGFEGVNLDPANSAQLRSNIKSVLDAVKNADRIEVTQPKPAKRVELKASPEGIAAAKERAKAEKAEAKKKPETPEEKAGREASEAEAKQRVDEAKKRLSEILGEMKKRGPAGRIAARAFEEVLKDGRFGEVEAYHAYLMSDIISHLFAGTDAKPNISFVKQLLLPDAKGKLTPAAGGRAAPATGMNGLIQLALAPEYLKYARENAAHEAFHALQDMIEEYDPKAARILFGRKTGTDEFGRGIYEGGIFRDGMTMDDLPKGVVSFLQQNSPDGNQSYWDRFREDLGTEEIGDQREMMAYVFGALSDAHLRGQSLGPVPGLMKRIAIAIANFRERMGNFLRGEGYTSAQDVLREYAMGRRQKGYGGEPIREGAATQPSSLGVNKIKASADFGMAHPDYRKLTDEVEAIARDGGGVLRPIKGGEITVVNVEDPNGQRAAYAVDDRDGVVGSLDYGTDGVQQPDVFVSEDWRRRGVASALYDVAEQSGGVIPEKNGVRTEGGIAFRSNRALKKAQASRLGVGRQEVIKRVREAGKLPLEVGQKFTTPKGRELGTSPWEVTGYFVDVNDPETMGYRVVREKSRSNPQEETTILVSLGPKKRRRYADMSMPVPDVVKAAKEFIPVGPTIESTVVPKQKPKKAADVTDEERAAERAEWESKGALYDEEGKLLTLYTGTSKDRIFKKFNVGRRGVWFSTNPEIASLFAKTNDSQNLVFNRITGKFDRVNDTSRVIPVHIRMENPLVLDAEGWQKMRDEVRRLGGDGAYGYMRGEAAVFEKYRAQGYDGIIATHTGDHVVLGSPDQIKSIFNTFEPGAARSTQFSRLMGRIEDERVASRDGSSIELTRKVNKSPEQTSIDVRKMADDMERLREQGSRGLFSLRRATRRLLDASNRFFDPKGKMSFADVYRALKNATVGEISILEKEAKQLYDALDKANPQQRKAIYDYLTTKGAIEPSLPPELAKAAKTAKSRIIAIGRDLADKKLLKGDVVAAREGKYLPRLYLKYMLEAPGYGTGSLRAGAMGWAKKLNEDLDKEIRAAYGEIKDPAFLSLAATAFPARDMAVLDFLNKIATATGSDWVLPDSLVDWRGNKVTPFWLMSEASDIRQRALLERDPEAKALMKKMAEEMQDVADRSGMKGKLPENYKQLPDTKRYGALRGMAVRKEIYDDVVGMGTYTGDADGFQKIFGDQNSKLSKGVQYWKMSKTVYNLPAHVRQFFSNGVMLNLSGVPAAMVPVRVTQAINAIMQKNHYWDIAMKHGVSGTGMVDQEIRTALEQIERAVKGSGDGPFNIPALRKAMEFVTLGPAKLYQLNDTLYKVAKIIDVMETQNKKLGRVAPNSNENFMREAIAAQEAHKWFMDYSDVQPWLKTARNAPLGMPFITYQWKVAPLLIETLLTQPWRFAPYVGLYFAAPVAAVSALGLKDEDDLEKLKKATLDFLRNNPGALPMPMRDEKNRFQFVDIGYIFPWSYFSSIGNTAVNALKGDAKLSDVLKSASVFSSPVLTTPTAIMANVDTFTGKPIYNQYDTTEQKAKDWLGYIWGQLAPPILTNYGAIGKPLGDYVFGGGEMVDRKGNPRETTGQLLARAVGFNVYPVDPKVQRQYSLSKMKYDINQTKARMTYAMRDRSLSPEQRNELRQKFREEIREKIQKMNEYARSTQLNERIRVQ